MPFSSAQSQSCACLPLREMEPLTHRMLLILIDGDAAATTGWCWVTRHCSWPEKMEAGGAIDDCCWLEKTNLGRRCRRPLLVRDDGAHWGLVGSGFATTASAAVFSAGSEEEDEFPLDF
ncbi:hypothetical protein ACLOJK_009023 [Asimina triloba]